MYAKSSTNPYNIAFTVQRIGHDYLFVISGGELDGGPHIGAVAVAYRDKGELKADTMGLPGHKESELTRESALLAATKLETTCTVICGIHIDQATNEQISEIVEYVRSCFYNLLEV
jgi:hypothetical protein